MITNNHHSTQSSLDTCCTIITQNLLTKPVGRISTNYSNNAVISFIKQSNPAKSPKDLIFISLPYNQSKTNETTQDQNLIYNYIHYAINPLLNSGTNTTTADADSSTRTSSTSGNHILYLFILNNNHHHRSSND